MFVNVRKSVQKTLLPELHRLLFVDEIQNCLDSKTTSLYQKDSTLQDVETSPLFYLTLAPAAKSISIMDVDIMLIIASTFMDVCGDLALKGNNV